MKKKVLCLLSCFMMAIALVVGVFSPAQMALAEEEPAQHTVVLDYNIGRVEDNLDYVPSTFRNSTANKTMLVNHGGYAKEGSKPNSSINKYYSYVWTVNNEEVDLSTYMILEDTTFVAKWIPKEYKIIFNLEDPTLESSISNYEATKIFTCEDKFVLYRPLLTGYTFKGWFDGKTYDSPVQVLPHNTSGDWVLTGKFVLDQYDINYYIGSAEVSGPRTYNVHDADIVLEDPVLEGYIFKGWYSDREFTQPISVIDCSLGGGVDVYADWEVKKYTVTYIMPDGSTAEVETEHGSKAALPKGPINIFRIVTTEESRNNITGDTTIHIKYIAIWYVYVIILVGLILAMIITVVVKKKKMEKHSYLRKLYQEHSEDDGRSF